MTDALAQWFLQAHEGGRPALGGRRAGAFRQEPDEAFAAWIEELRDREGMRNDDVTLVSLEAGHDAQGVTPMSWPLSQDYNEAIQSPRSNFTDPDLQRGEAVCNALGLPMPCSGNFADVYQVRCPDGNRWAVKCFTREAVGLRERYQEISAPSPAGQAAVHGGLQPTSTRASACRRKWYPVLKMQWVEGLTLNEFVASTSTSRPCWRRWRRCWVKMAKYLRAAQVGHCDLQHGNVLLVPGATPNSLALKLIDYDGMWVPALAGTKSGEVGHPSYQHPQRLREGTYSLEVDRFPLLLIATALRALKARGKELWDRYDNGDNLLFKESDLREPTKSALFQELNRIGDPSAVALTLPLLRSLWARLESVPLLEEVMPDAGPASVLPTRPSRLGKTATVAVAAAVTQAAPVVAAPPPTADSMWEFDESAPDRTAPAGLPSRTRKRASRAKSGGVAVAVWTIVALVVLGGAAGAYFLMNGGGHEKPGGAPSVPDKKPVGGGPAPLLTNSIGMRLVRIEPGGFRMGSPDDEKDRFDNEGPRHRVEITRPFYLGACPVTKGQFAVFARDDDYRTEAEEAGDARTWRYPGFSQTDDDPVVEVTWNDAVRFCEWLSRKEKQTYELPTEAQWEYACRAGTKTRYFFGDDSTDLDAYAWYGENSENHTHPVGGKKPNPWGLYDMNGDVWQCCADAYEGNYYGKSPEKDPKNLLDTGAHAARGGSWGDSAMYCRAADRCGVAPTDRDIKFGFRVCGLAPLSDAGEKTTGPSAPQTVKEEKPPIVFADFEGRDYGDWKATGQAFGAGPAYGTLPRQLPVSGYEGRGLVNSFHGGDNAVGSLTSPEFTIQRSYIYFLIGGGNRPGTACINLHVDGKVVRSATGKNNERLEWCIWDVRDFAGKIGRFRIVDNAGGPWGHINIDQIEFRNARAAPGELAPRRKIGSRGRDAAGAMRKDDMTLLSREAVRTPKEQPRCHGRCRRTTTRPSSRRGRTSPTPTCSGARRSPTPWGCPCPTPATSPTSTRCAAPTARAGPSSASPARCPACASATRRSASTWPRPSCRSWWTLPISTRASAWPAGGIRSSRCSGWRV